MPCRAMPSQKVMELQVLHDEARDELHGILRVLQGTKVVVAEESVYGVIRMFLSSEEGNHGNVGMAHKDGIPSMQDMKVSRLVSLEQWIEDKSDTAEEHAVFFTKTRADAVKKIAKCIQEMTSRRTTICFVPCRTLLCEQILDEEGVMTKTNIQEYHLDLVVYDSDLLLLNEQKVFRDVHIEGDGGRTQVIAKSVSKLQTIFGVIPNVKAKGGAAVDVLRRMMRARVEESHDALMQSDLDGINGLAMTTNTTGGETRSGVKIQPAIDTLLLLDRQVDLSSVMLTPLTYEGLIDEFMEIQNGCIRLPSDSIALEDEKSTITSSGGNSSKSMTPSKDKDPYITVALNSTDPLYKTIRDLNVEALGPYLQRQAKSIRESYSAFRNQKDANVFDIHDFVKKIPNLTQGYRSLSIHINIAEKAKKETDSLDFREKWQTERALVEGEGAYDKIEELIYTHAPIDHVLRLLCLQSLTTGGIKAGKYDFLRKEIISSYGYDLLHTLTYLEKCGALKKREMTFIDAGSNWNTLRKSLRLVNDQIDISSPDDISFVSSGYAPLSVRLVQACVSPGWEACAETMKLLPGPTVEITQDEAQAQELHQAIKRSSSGLQPTKGETRRGKQTANGKRVMLVYFVGGVTSMEISACRFLSHQDEFPFEIVIAATSLINGRRFMDDLRDI